MSPAAPVGVSGLMARMPRWFVEHANKAQRRAQRRREAQAQRFALALLGQQPQAEHAQSQWQDTVVDFKEVQ